MSPGISREMREEMLLEPPTQHLWAGSSGTRCLTRQWGCHQHLSLWWALPLPSSLHFTQPEMQLWRWCGFLKGKFWTSPKDPVYSSAQLSSYSSISFSYEWGGLLAEALAGTWRSWLLLEVACS